MIEIHISIIVRQRDALSKELPRGRPPYSSRFNTKRNDAAIRLTELISVHFEQPRTDRRASSSTVIISWSYAARAVIITR